MRGSLGADPTDVANEVAHTIGAHARFKFLEELYKDHLHMALDAEGDDMLVEYYRQCALRCYLLFLIGKSMFVDKSETYVDVVYLKYFMGLTEIHEYVAVKFFRLTY